LAQEVATFAAIDHGQHMFDRWRLDGFKAKTRLGHPR